MMDSMIAFALAALTVFLAVGLVSALGIGPW
jgi:hypothetical protein